MDLKSGRPCAFHLQNILSRIRVSQDTCVHAWDSTADASFSYSATVENFLNSVVCCDCSIRVFDCLLYLEYLLNCSIRISLPCI